MKLRGEERKENEGKRARDRTLFGRGLSTPEISEQTTDAAIKFCD